MPSAGKPVAGTKLLRKIAGILHKRGARCGGSGRTHAPGSKGGGYCGAPPILFHTGDGMADLLVIATFGCPVEAGQEDALAGTVGITIKCRLNSLARHAR